MQTSRLLNSVHDLDVERRRLLQVYSADVVV